MRLVTRLYLSAGVLLAIGVGLAALAGWSANQAAFLIEREHLAHRSYEAHLSLSNHIYQLFKQLGDARSIGDRDRGRGEAELIDRIRSDIATIRKLIATEIDLVGTDEVRELERLARIESQVDALLAEHQAVFIARPRLSLETYWDRLSKLLDDWIDKDFNALIQEAIAEEEREVRATRLRAAEQIGTTRRTAVSLALLSVIAGIWGVWLLARSVLGPVEALSRGAQALASGNLGHRVDESGPAELGELARAFNRMAAEISAREFALSRANTQLEEAVAVRTAELEKLLETVRENDRNRKRLLADVSHELRTPLTIIRGEAEVALRGEAKSPESYREALQKAHDAALHTSRLVDDLLFVARREAGELRLKKEAVELVAILNESVQEFQGLALRQRGSIRIAAPLGEFRVQADGGRIRQVVAVLLENALRYGGDRIDVRLEKADEGYAVTVADNGSGMTGEEVTRAFERFYRGADAAQRYAQGTGLGLPVAKAIVEAHGGSITLSSVPGEGVSVCFTLPARSRLRAVS